MILKCILLVSAAMILLYILPLQPCQEQQWGFTLENLWMGGLLKQSRLVMLLLWWKIWSFQITLTDNQWGFEHLGCWNWFTGYLWHAYHRLHCKRWTWVVTTTLTKQWRVYDYNPFGRFKNLIKATILIFSCPLDSEIMGAFEYSQSKTTALVHFQAHKFPHTASVYYQCNIRLCIRHAGGCDDVVIILATTLWVLINLIIKNFSLQCVMWQQGQTFCLFVVNVKQLSWMKHVGSFTILIVKILK